MKVYICELLSQDILETMQWVSFKMINNLTIPTAYQNIKKNIFNNSYYQQK